MMLNASKKKKKEASNIIEITINLDIKIFEL